MRILIRVVVVALLGAATALLVSCGSSGTGLIPAANATPLQEDFEAVERAAEAGNGDCAATESALGKTQQDFLELPESVDKGLHKRLEQGITNLHKVALEMCTQPASTATTSTSTTTSTPQAPIKTSTTTTTPTSSTPTSTTTTSTQTPPAATTPSSPSGGTEAGGEEAREKGVGKGTEESAGGGAGAAQEGGGNSGASVGGASPGGAQ
ncbi:MAG: hypothetical protein WBQ21_03360 [Solirubrobacteraceae bacterium]